MASHAVEVFVATTNEQASAAEAGLVARAAHEFLWRHHCAPYDLIVYQLGNARCHDFIWPYLFQFPGLVVLHDAHLHHARAGALLDRGRRDDYTAELVFNHPELTAQTSIVGISGFGGALAFYWPMLRAVVTSARLIAVHNPIVAADLSASFDARVETIRLGVRDPFGAVEARDRLTARFQARERLGIRHDSFVILAYGGIMPEKRIAAATRALAALRTHGDVRLILVGGVAPHYDPVADARAAGVADRVAVTGFVSNSDIPAYLLAADVALALRWPTARETSAAWAECLAAGLPTMLSDLAHLAHVPTLSARDWRRPPAADPIAIAVDLFDEEEILIRGLRRLMADQTLRERLGRAARAYFEAHHTVSGMVADYLRAIDAGAMRSAPETELPAHLRPDPLAHARHLAAAVGVDLSMQ